jgi:trehalose-6-phosphatase
MPSEATYLSPIDFLMVVGDGREDEVIFRWANELGKDKTIANVTTVSLGSRNTEAGCTLTQGVTGMSSTLFLEFPR